MVTVSVPDKTYQVQVLDGLRHEIGKKIRQVWSPRQILVITDKNVADLYLSDTVVQLQSAGYHVATLVLPAGERSKSLASLEKAISCLAEHQFTRADGVIALGGGVVGDLAGLTAATYMRGIAFIQIATSLTAQVDSSVGGKTAINLGQTKNIMGTFYQPDLVLIDPTYLKTLAIRDLVEGYAEVIKCSALAGGDFWQLTGTIRTVNDILTRSSDLITQSVQYKADIVMQDEREAGIRKYLNFGHTIGHAIELLAEGGLRHGEAVAIGMIAITERFVAENISSSEFLQALNWRLQLVGLPVNSALIRQPATIDQLAHDKKNLSGILQLVAVKEPGQPAIIKKSLAEMTEFIEGAS